MKNLLARLKKVFSNRVFSRLLLCYMVLIAMLAGICIVSYNQARSLCEIQICERSELLFRQSTAQLQNVYNFLDAFSCSLTAQEDVSALLTRTGTASNDYVYDIYRLIHTLPELTDSTGLLEGYYLYLPSISAIVSPGKGFRNIRNYYPSFFALDPAQSYDNWAREVLDSVGVSIHASWENASLLQYVVPLGIQRSSGFSSKLIFQVNGQRLLNQLTALLPDHFTCAAIVSGEGEILSITDPDSDLVQMLETCDLSSAGSVECRFSGRKYILSLASLSQLGTRLIILIPYSLVTAQALESVRPFLNILLWMLFLAVCLVVLLALTNIVPLAEIAESINNTDIEGSGMKLVSEAYIRMQHNQQSLEELMISQKTHIRNACVNRLIHGKPWDPYNLEEMLTYSGLEIRGCHYRGVYIRLSSQKLEDISRSILLELLQPYSMHLAFLTFENLNVIACLYVRSDEDPTVARPFFTGIYEALCACGLEATFFIGQPCDQLEKIPESFATASWLMDTSMREEWLCIAEDTPGTGNLMNILSSEEEKKLETLIATGLYEEASDLLDRIYQRNFVDQHLHGFHRQFLYCRMIGILAACDRSVQTETSLPEKTLDLSGSAFFDWYRQQILKMTTELQDRNSQKSRLLIDEICAYIREHYTDYSLSLSSLAIHFGITGNYLSTIFKKEKEMNFSAYLEGIRIGHAEEMLSQTGASVSEIAQKVGYTSDDSFRRAFRRATGVTPAQYRGGTHSD